MEKIALEKPQLISAIKTGLQEHYDYLQEKFDDENIDTFFHLVTGSIMDNIEDQYLKWKGQ